MLVLAPASLDPAALGELPDQVELRLVDDEPAAGDLAAVEVAVNPAGALLERLVDMPRLRAVVVTSAGVDHLGSSLPPQVQLANARGARDAAVAEWVVGAILAVEKRLIDQRDAQRFHRWAPFHLPDVEGRTAVILGHGSIGRAVQARLEPFGAEVIGVGRTASEGVRGAEELGELLPRAQILVVLLPLTDATRGSVGAEQLALLPDGALVVNAGRGAVLDTEALLAEVQRERLRAALDVTDPEPLPEDHPLWSAPGVFISPHVAGDTARADAAALRLAGEQLRRLAWGAPLLNVVER